MTRIGLTLTICGVAGAAAAGAQTLPGGAERVLAPFAACRQTPDAAARAACYDAALDRLQGAVATKQVAIVDREQATQDRRTHFGFMGEHPAKVPKGAKLTPSAPEELAEIDTTVVSARPYSSELWIIRVATGATWRTTEPGISFAPKPGSKVHLKRGVLGSYFLKAAGERAVKAIRVG